MIEDGMKHYKKIQDKQFNIVLIGECNSGKSTIMKQIHKIHGQPVTDWLITDYPLVNVYSMENYSQLQIRESIISYMRLLCKKSKDLRIDLESKQNEEYRDWFIDNEYNDMDKQEIANKIKVLWRDSGIQSTYQRCDVDERFENMEYFVDNIDRIMSAFNPVGFDDFIRIKTNINGCLNQEFKIKRYNKSFKYVYHEIGNSKNERLKWINIMKDEIEGVIFVHDMSKMNQFELIKSLNLFQSILNKGFCRNKLVTIFFNKYDIFVEKLKNKGYVDFGQDWPNDKDPRDANDICDYVYDKFIDIYDTVRQTNGGRYNSVPHYQRVLALDTDQIDNILADMESDLVRQGLYYHDNFFVS